MGGFFGAAERQDAVFDTFFGTDYHSHLGTSKGGMASYNDEIGLQREIHNIHNSPFRTKFEKIFEEISGNSAIGCISDSDPQPLLIRSALGCYAICTIGIIRNADDLIKRLLATGKGYFNSMTGGVVNSTELIAALINLKPSFEEGIRFAQNEIEGTASILILCDDGSIIAARDLLGRLPVLIGKKAEGHCVSFESFAYQKLGFETAYELGPGEIVRITADSFEQLLPPGDKMQICAFLWSYYGYPNSNYEGVNVETMRYRNGEIMAENDNLAGNNKNVDFVGGVPDSGTPHAIGYSRNSGIPFARPFIKYTPTWARSFMPVNQTQRDQIAKMKQIPIHELIEGKSLLFVDDSIVRGTQLRETVEFLYENGAKAVHIRSACPPLMYGCKYLNFSRAKSELELITRRTVIELEGEEGLAHLDEYSDATTERGKKMRQTICDKLHFSSLEFQSLEGIIKAIGVDPSKLCTYCWSGRDSSITDNK